MVHPPFLSRRLRAGLESSPGFHGDRHSKTLRNQSKSHCLRRTCSAGSQKRSGRSCSEGAMANIPWENQPGDFSGVAEILRPGSYSTARFRSQLLPPSISSPPKTSEKAILSLCEAIVASGCCICQHFKCAGFVNFSPSGVSGNFPDIGLKAPCGGEDEKAAAIRLGLPLGRRIGTA